jgi:hypothetical protein
VADVEEAVVVDVVTEGVKTRVIASAHEEQPALGVCRVVHKNLGGSQLVRAQSEHMGMSR